MKMNRNNRQDDDAGDDAQNELNRRSFLRLMSAGTLAAGGAVAEKPISYQ